jgi:hypothetical protein
MSKIKKLATIGCSHSSYFAGQPWPVFLKEELECELIIANSPGASNEMNLEKVKFLVDQNPDLLIIQLTDPARFTLGLYQQKQLKEVGMSVVPQNLVENPNYLEGSHHYNGQLYYTFNIQANDDNLRNLTGYDDITVDHFIINHVIPSNYNLYQKVLHTMSTMSFMAEKKNVPVVFFSWSVDIHKIIAESGYSDIFKDLKIIPGYIEEFVASRKLKPVPQGMLGDGHHGPENQKIICNDYVLPYLKEYNLV